MNSTMLESIDHPDPTPLHDQVLAQIRRAVADGGAKPEERLPPARDLGSARQQSYQPDGLISIVQSLR
jgi:DNA-binding transcriptional regulator YhcF (GntR family)